MAQVDPDERFTLPDDTDPDEVLRRLLEPAGDHSAHNEPDEDSDPE